MERNDKKFHMRRKDKEITDLGKIEEVIGKATVCHLGLVDNGEPYIVPVNFGYEGNSIYFHSAPAGRKVDLIKRNNKVCFEIETDVEIGISSESRCEVKYRSVIGTGKAHIVEDNQEKTLGLKSIMRQCAVHEYSFSEDRLDSVLVVRIDIDSVTGKQAGY